MCRMCGCVAQAEGPKHHYAAQVWLRANRLSGWLSAAQAALVPLVCSGPSALERAALVLALHSRQNGTPASVSACVAVRCCVAAFHRSGEKPAWASLRSVLKYCIACRCAACGQRDGQSGRQDDWQATAVLLFICQYGMDADFLGIHAWDG